VNNMTNPYTQMWKDVLQIPDVHDYEMQDVDYSDDEEFCCNNAKNQILSVFSDVKERYKRENRQGKVINADNAIDALDTLDCKELKTWIKKKIDRADAEIPKGMKVNPEIVRLKDIYNDWRKCEGA